MPTVLFDIDGTLMNAAGAGRRAMQRTVLQLYGIATTPDVPLHGRTDFAIFNEVLSLLNLSAETEYPVFRRHYHHHIEQVLAETDSQRPELLPGVLELIESMNREGDWCLGLITGNSRFAAMAKLRTVGFQHHFSDGGFGDWTPCRNAVAAEAMRNCASKPVSDDQDAVVMIGDTIHDVSCAQSVGVPVIGVLTGGTDRESLAASGADWVIESMRELTSTRLREFTSTKIRRD
jgi:phosphoglycolate phosphatase-like HAD superfamily hydrolase